MCTFWKILKPTILRSPVKFTGRFAGGFFRARRGLPAANNEWDGRTPKITTVGQKRRLIEQYAMTKRIVTLSAELNESNRRLKEQQDANAKRRAELKEHLLKEKGLKKLI